MDANKVSDLARRLPADIQSTEFVQSLIHDPMQTVVAMITGAVASGRTDLTLGVGRVLQATLKGRIMLQLCEELEDFVAKAKIKADYAETKYGTRSLVELMKAIDEGETDEDKLQAAKAMFIALNSPETATTEETLRYQLFQIVLKLTGPQLMLLKTCDRMRRNGHFSGGHTPDGIRWRQAVAKEMGHGLQFLVDRDGHALEENDLLIPYRANEPQNSISGAADGRLTDLGVRLVNLIENYEKQIPNQDSK